ncbi:MAG: MarR family transcriptional regulator [Tenuifilaceae bacterium]|jgi:DNA-binding MarR family transcriptional regulator|nr:MarR family transcriptional regulator [Tenuifilaceae bacterium]
MEFEQLKLSNQLCFPVYAASRLITREYKPYLDKLGITYPQYLVLMVLWETDGLTVVEIAHKLILNTNTITPLLKRMESQGILTRTRSGADERKVIVSLTKKGKEMRIQAATIPEELVKNLKTDSLKVEDLITLRSTLNNLIDFLIEKDGNF